MTADEWTNAEIEAEIEERFSTAIALWSDAHGCEVRDYTKEQIVRLKLWAACGYDGDVAKRLAYCQWLARQGVLA